MKKINNKDLIFNRDSRIYTVKGDNDICIDANGFRYGVNTNPNISPKISPIDPEQIGRASVYVMRVTKNKIVNTTATSYGLKHRAEKYNRHIHKAEDSSYEAYCSNGAFISAMIEAGFDIYLNEHEGLNVYFNYSTRSTSKIRTEILNVEKQTQHEGVMRW